MTAGVTTDTLLDLSGSDGLFECFLETTFVQVIANDRACAGVLAAGTGGEDILPNPLTGSVRLFAIADA